MVELEADNVIIACNVLSLISVMTTDKYQLYLNSTECCIALIAVLSRAGKTEVFRKKEVL